MEDFYTNGYKIGWNHTGNREDENRTIIITDIGEDIAAFPRTFICLLSWKEGETRLYKKIKTIDPRDYKRRKEVGSVVDLRNEQAKDILAGIKEFIQTIEQTKYTPKAYEQRLSSSRR